MSDLAERILDVVVYTTPPGMRENLLEKIRAELACEDDEQDIEALSAEVHQVYCQAYEKRFGKPYHTGGDYSKLDEATKDYDRAFVRWHLSKLARVDDKRFEECALEIEREAFKMCDEATEWYGSFSVAKAAAIMRKHFAPKGE